MREVEGDTQRFRLIECESHKFFVNEMHKITIKADVCMREVSVCACVSECVCARLCV